MNVSEIRAGWVALEEQDRKSEGFATLELETSLPAGPVLQAIDAQGRRHFLLPCKAPPAVEDTGSAGVKILSLQLTAGTRVGQFVDLRCDLDRLAELFDDVAVDLVAAAGARPDQPAEACIAALEHWRALLRTVRPAAASRAHLVGLIAELILVAEVVSRDPARRIDFWVGREGQRHDLRRADTAVEVKGTVAATGRSVSIHGLRQLEPPSGGSLYLGFVRLEQVAGGTLTIDVLVDRLRALGLPSHAVYSGLDERGLPPGTADERAFELIEWKLYPVGPDFPSVVPALFPSGEAPSGLEEVRYTVDLDGAACSALTDAEQERVLQDLATGGSTDA